MMVNKGYILLMLWTAAVFFQVVVGCSRLSNDVVQDTDFGEDHPEIEMVISRIPDALGRTTVCVKWAGLDGAADPDRNHRLINGRLTLCRFPTGEELLEIDLVQGVGVARGRITRYDSVRLKDEEGRPLEDAVLLHSPRDTVYVSGDLPDSLLDWYGHQSIAVTGDVRVPEGKTLTIFSGTQVEIFREGNIVVDGSLMCNGTSDSLVYFQPLKSDEPWGGVVVNGSAYLENAVFTQGGAGTEYVAGHSNSRGVISVYDASVEVLNSYFINNPGKGLFSDVSALRVEGSVISFCDMGGEFASSAVSVLRSHILYLPDNTTHFVDDDNDGFYFLNFFGAESDSVFSRVDGCVFFHGKDDAIDHNGAFLTVSNSWISDFEHEGLAASTGRVARVYNSLIKKCENGIEAGYGAPRVEVNHSVLTENDYGFRFGDNYDVGSNGRMWVTNSISYGNRLKEVWNYDILTAGSVDSGIVISYSMVGDADYMPGVNNLADPPQWDENYLLLEGSPGKGQAGDGKDIGLINDF